MNLTSRTNRSAAERFLRRKPTSWKEARPMNVGPKIAFFDENDFLLSSLRSISSGSTADTFVIQFFNEVGVTIKRANKFGQMSWFSVERYWKGRFSKDVLRSSWRTDLKMDKWTAWWKWCWNFMHKAKRIPRQFSLLLFEFTTKVDHQTTSKICSKLSDDRPWSWNRRLQRKLSRVRFALCIIKALRLTRLEHCSGTVVSRFLLLLL